ncbi:MAG: hypothetical protein WCO44_15900, partial [Bacteroidota bacterium]
LNPLVFALFCHLTTSLFFGTAKLNLFPGKTKIISTFYSNPGKQQFRGFPMDHFHTFTVTGKYS